MRPPGRTARSLLAVSFFALLLAGRPAGAEETPAPKVREIVVVGARMVEEATVRARIGSREGSPYDADQVSRDVRSLFELGTFEDIKVDADGFEGGIRLTFRLVERPLVNALEITGNKEISTEDLREKAALTLTAPYNPVAVAAAVERMRAAYREKGYYQARVITTIDPSGEGRVRIKAVVEEGDTYRLVAISLQGVKSLPESELLGEMKTSPWTILSWLTSTGKLQLGVLQEDRQRLVSYYQDRGYLEVRVGEPDIAVDDTSRTVRVTIQITEGLQYRLGGISQQGDDLLSLDDIKRLLGLKEGEIFRRSAFAQGVFAMNQRYASRGYAFVKLDYATRLDPVARTIDVNFLVERGPEARFGRISVSGNVTTRDKVVRRELTFAEGDVFNSAALARSRQKVMNLGFFEAVDLVPRPREDRVIDVEISVKERLTGAITFGVGYSSEDHLTGQLRLSESNLFGRGHSLALTFEKSPVRANYSLSFNEPSLFDSAWSAGFSIYDSMREFDEYDRKSIGGRLTLGRSLGEYIRSYVSFKHETVTVSDIADTASIYIKDQEGEKTTTSMRLTLVRDTRDNFMNPTRGNRTSLSGEYAGGILGGDNYFTKYELEHSTYVPLPLKLVGMVHGEYGKVQGFGEVQSVDADGNPVRDAQGNAVFEKRKLPIYEKFFLGGILTLRGFPSRSVGPIDENGEPKGGFQQLYFNTELIIPVAPEQGFNLVAFFDTGYAWDAGESIQFSDFRESAGLGVRWMSPIGPFRLEWGFILDRREGEPKSDWAFMIGNFF
jgi:outer membrane protein insertion porin family